MKNVLLAAVLVSALAGIGQARAATLSQFEADYKGMVKEARQLGYVPQRVCFPTYCANQMVMSYQNGDVVLLANIVTSEGIGFQEFCQPWNHSHSVRWCASSAGTVWSERHVGEGWQTIKTFATHFDDGDSASAE